MHHVKLIVVYLYNNRKKISMKDSIFEISSYAKDYIFKGKIVGTEIIKIQDREQFGYPGKITETLSEDVKLTNGKILKKGTIVDTEITPICGRAKKVFLRVKI